MPKEKKTVELKDEELEKVTGGWKPGEEPTTPPSNSGEIMESNSKGLYCPDCYCLITNSRARIEPDIFCPKCKKYVIPIEK